MSPHKWSPIRYKSSAGQRKHIGQRPMLYRWTTQPTRRNASAATLYSERRVSSEEDTFVIDECVCAPTRLRSGADSKSLGRRHLRRRCNYRSIEVWEVPNRVAVNAAVHLTAHGKARRRPQGPFQGSGPPSHSRADLRD